MATEKFFVFNEDGALKRLKGRIVRYLDNEDPTGSDKSAIRTSLEVSPDAAGLVQADIGTQPNEIPVNGMLGDMAYQSSDGVSMAKAEIESTTGTATTQALTVTDGSNTKLVVQEDGSVGINTATPSQKLDCVGRIRSSYNSGDYFEIGSTDSGGFVIGSSGGTEKINLRTYGDSYFTGGRVGIGTASLGSYFTGTDDLVVAGTSGDHGVTIATPNTANGGLMFADSDSTTVGRIQYSHGTNSMNFRVNNAEVWSINSSGNLQANGAYGIDFGSAAAAGRTVESGLLSDYEIGTWSPVYSTSAAAMTTPPTMDIIHARYVKVGGLVHLEAYIRTDSVDTSGGSGNLMITGLPFAPHTGSYSSVQVSLATDWGTDTPLSGYAYPTGITLLKRSSVNGITSNMSVTDLTNGTTANQNRLIFSAAYYTSA